MRTLRSLLICAATSLSVGCSTNGAGVGGRVMSANATPLSVDLRAVRLSGGMQWLNLLSNAPKPRRMLLLAPTDVTAGGERRPLVVFLHGGAGAEKLPKRFQCLLAPAFERLSPAPIFVAPDAGGEDWWSDANAALVLGIVDAAVRDWPVRTDRVVIMGYSNGGIGSWFFARLYPEWFSAAIPMASNSGIMGETPLPVRAIHGTNDTLFAVAKVRAAVDKLHEQGVNVTLTVKEGGQHEDICAYVHELESAVDWLNLSWAAAPAATAR
ncbi:MAG: hypothetical protein QM756_36085 [Polyangiaceae bacterium]